MRVTNSMLVKNFMSNLNNGMNKLDRIQSQLATNRKYAHVSDDPVAVIYSQQARNKLNRLAQYEQNVSLAQSWLATVETSVLEMNELIKSAYDQCIDLSTNVKTDSDREAASEYLGQLTEQIVQTLNTSFGDKFVFGGYNTTGYLDASGNVQPPFTVRDTTVDDPANPPNTMVITELCLNGIGLISKLDAAGVDRSDTFDELEKEILAFDIGPGIEMEVTLSGIAVSTEPVSSSPPLYQNLFKLFNDFYITARDGGTVEELQAFISPLQEAQNNILALSAEIGGRNKRLEIVASRYGQDEINYTQMKSDAEDADQAEIIMNYKMAESVYKAALATGAYIIQPTLMDFLR